MTATKNLFRRPALELLETRLAPAVHTWTGAASDLWSDDANWDGGSPAGDPKAELVFPQRVATRMIHNDLDGLTVESIHFLPTSMNYLVRGNPITLGKGGIRSEGSGLGWHIIYCDLQLAADLRVETTVSTARVQFDGDIRGDYGLVKVGSGQLFSNGTKTYTGPTLLDEGATVHLAGTNPLGTGPLTINNIGQIFAHGAGLTNPFTVTRTVSIGSESFSLGFNGPGTIAAGATIRVLASVNVTFTGNLSGEGSISLEGGTSNLGGVNTYTGTTRITGGLFRLMSPNTLPPATELFLGSTARLDLNGFDAAVGSLTGSGSVMLRSGSLTVGNDHTSTTFSGVISGEGSVTKVGEGAWTLSGRNGFSGGLTVLEGEVQLAGPITTPGVGPLTILGGTVEVRQDVLLEAGLINAGTLRVGDSRRLAVYGSDVVNAGIVQLEHWSTLFVYGSYDQVAGVTILEEAELEAPTVTIGEGSYLFGTGSIVGTVWNHGVLVVGDVGSAGLLTISGDYLQTATGILALDLGDAGTRHYDSLEVTGRARLDGTLAVALLDDFRIEEGDAFAILMCSRLEGDFADYALPDLGDEFFLDPQRDASGLTLFTIRR